jgi:integrase
MTQEIIIAEGHGVPAESAPDLGIYAEKPRAEGTWRSYVTDFDGFARWAAGLGYSLRFPIDPRRVAQYALALHFERGRKPRTIRRMVTAISIAHQTPRAFWRRFAERHPEAAAGAPVDAVPTGPLPFDTRHPELVAVLANIDRQADRRPNKRAPLMMKHVGEFLRGLDLSTTRAKRDRAMILLAFLGGRRRSEVSRLDTAPGGTGDGWIEFQDRGLVIHLARSKTNQVGRAESYALERVPDQPLVCPVAAVRDWMAAADLSADEPAPLFPAPKGGRDKHIEDRVVWRLAKRVAEAQGMDPRAFGGHSFRRGHATQARELGADMTEIMRTGGWRSETMVREYIDQVDQWKATGSKLTQAWAAAEG